MQSTLKTYSFLVVINHEYIKASLIWSLSNNVLLWFFLNLNLNIYCLILFCFGVSQLLVLWKKHFGSFFTSGNTFGWGHYQNMSPVVGYHFAHAPYFSNVFDLNLEPYTFLTFERQGDKKWFIIEFCLDLLRADLKLTCHDLDSYNSWTIY